MQNFMINVMMKDGDSVLPYKLMKKEKPKKKKLQHTKFLLNILILAFCVIGFSSMYINYKNGCSMDVIFESICSLMKWVLPSGCAKSVIETNLEKKLRLQYLEKGLNYEENDNQTII